MSVKNQQIIRLSPVKRLTLALFHAKVISELPCYRYRMLALLPAMPRIQHAYR